MRAVDRTRRVLICDDYDAMRLLVETHLADDPEVTVVAAVATVDEALREIEREAPDVIVLDLGLPDASGPDAVSRIRATAPDTWIVLFSGLEGDDSRVADALGSGADVFVSKSSSIAALRAAIAL